MCYAEVDKASGLSYPYNNTGNFMLEIGSDGSVYGKIVTPTTNFFKIHGWIMWAAWGILGLA
jgi:hypothetical protein